MGFTCKYDNDKFDRPLVGRPVNHSYCGPLEHVGTVKLLGGLEHVFHIYIYVIIPTDSDELIFFRGVETINTRKKYAFEEKTMCVSETQLKDLEKNASVRAGMMIPIDLSQFLSEQ